MAISVSIVEDDPKTREIIADILRAAPGLRLLKSYPTGEEAVSGIPRQPPDVALVDINLPGINGINCVGKLRTALPKLQILMLTTYEDRDLIFDALRAGAHGYLLKKAPPAELVQAVEQVHVGGAPMSIQIARKVVNHFQQARETSSEIELLTPREQEILELFAKGFSYKEISGRLNISMSTVSTHAQHIFEKLHVQSRTQAAAKFLNRE